ncbi:hypothetical protein Fot_50426 [Forsythia ovata]|uniref:Uncharacterized protein n=1 Tax=Forsythia ovata TaxID=205694 RepID=A0ABD1PY76_9LAMI
MWSLRGCHVRSDYVQCLSQPHTTTCIPIVSPSRLEATESLTKAVARHPTLGTMFEGTTKSEGWPQGRPKRSDWVGGSPTPTIGLPNSWLKERITNHRLFALGHLLWQKSGATGSSQKRQRSIGFPIRKMEESLTFLNTLMIDATMHIA